MPWNSRPSTAAIAALVALSTLMLLSGCSTDDDASPSSTTTGIADPVTTTTAPSSTSLPGQAPSQEMPGLWLASPAGILDEEQDVWAEPRPGEVLRSPLSDGVGGVIYLRCTGDQVPCAIEDVQVKGAPPVPIGQADTLLAVGSAADHRVLLTSWTDATIVPSFEENRSQLVARLIDLDSTQVTPLAGWFGWESGPFAADVEQGRFVTCSGEGETCGFASGDDPNLLNPIDNVEPATVMSVALDAEATRATWVETAPMSGEIRVHVLDITTGAVTSFDLQPDTAPASDDSVTDGTWVAVRTGTQVVLSQLNPTGSAGVTGNTGTRTLPEGITDMSIREPAGGGGGPGLAL